VIITVIIENADEALYEGVMEAIDRVPGVDEYYIGLQTPEQRAADPIVGERTKAYLATSGEYSDYRVCHAFAREEDAMSYGLGDDVLELEIHEGPIEVRNWHFMTWHPHLPDRQGDTHAAPNPLFSTERRDFDGRPKHAEHRWDVDHLGHQRLIVQGWHLERVQKVYSEQRAQYIARKDMGVES
jgi:hypothetical protein